MHVNMNDGLTGGICLEPGVVNLRAVSITHCLMAIPNLWSTVWSVEMLVSQECVNRCAFLQR